MSKQTTPAHPQQAQTAAQPATPGSCPAHGPRAARRPAAPLPGKGHPGILDLRPGGEEA